MSALAKIRRSRIGLGGACLDCSWHDPGADRATTRHHAWWAGHKVQFVVEETTTYTPPAPTPSDTTQETRP